MAENSKIEWTDHTINLWWGCAKVHTGCKNCYAEHLSETRHKNGIWGEETERKRIRSAFHKLVKFQKDAKKSDVMARVFIGSMMDIFEDSKPLRYIEQDDIEGYTSLSLNLPGDPTFVFTSTRGTTAQLRTWLFDLISNGAFPNITFQFLTKRPENINKMIPGDWAIHGAPDNVWFGTSVSNHETYMSVMKKLDMLNQKIFLSIEPQVDYFRLESYPHWQAIVDWVIVGGESGPNRRPYNPDWARTIRDACKKASVPFFMKQIDKVILIPKDLLIRQFPESMKPTTPAQ